jgi:hypothetical protein
MNTTEGSSSGASSTSNMEVFQKFQKDHHLSFPDWNLKNMCDDLCVFFVQKKYIPSYDPFVLDLQSSKEFDDFKQLKPLLDVTKKISVILEDIPSQDFLCFISSYKNLDDLYLRTDPDPEYEGKFSLKSLDFSCMKKSGLKRLCVSEKISPILTKKQLSEILDCENFKILDCREIHSKFFDIISKSKIEELYVFKPSWIKTIIDKNRTIKTIIFDCNIDDEKKDVDILSKRKELYSIIIYGFSGLPILKNNNICFFSVESDDSVDVNNRSVQVLNIGEETFGKFACMKNVLSVNKYIKREHIVLKKSVKKYVRRKFFQ